MKHSVGVLVAIAAIGLNAVQALAADAWKAGVAKVNITPTAPVWTWVAGYSNDVMAYIPSLRVLREGGYEGVNAQVYYGLPTRWSEDIEAQIVEQVQRESSQVSAAAP